ncbi:shikimate dehydrogenase [Campylobacter geochelonis]|uniref:shikimate dehydrogenase n=1 Tax=Campylobacter geochelonis TaxID=1780362 RepID=UPI0007708373|nr:shikimate dehydrogenase [Campylobacter geochelonis]CZE50993.1 shikimate 5-dehydrogenase [Campylobacter geochelonis]
MKKFAVFGDPIAHSISPRLHNLAIKELNLDAFYGRVWLKDGALLKAKFNTLGLDGANITVPYKQVAFEICDVLDSHAKNIGSVNTIVKKDDLLYGYNTDAPGFLKSIAPFEGIKTALIIGAGGTSKALAYALKSQNIEIDIINRSKNRLSEFSDFNTFSWDDFTPKGYDLVVNSTSAGLKDDEFPMPQVLLKEVLKGSKFAFDVIYNKPTPFLNLANSLNLKSKNGADMLIFQAVLALNLFYNQSLDEDKITSSMQKAMSL